MSAKSSAFAALSPSASLQAASADAFICRRRVKSQPRLQCPPRPLTFTRALAAAPSGGSGKSTARRKDDTSAEASRGLHVDRRDIENGQAGSKSRGVRLSRESTLGKIDVVDEGGGGKDADEPVSVSVVIQPVGDDFRVLGRVTTNVLRLCDRCCSMYTEVVDGESFEVWLDSGDGLGVDRDAEAIEDFVGPRARVDLSPHVHDAVILGLPSRASCGDGCLGVVGPQGGILSSAGSLVSSPDQTDGTGSSDETEVEDGDGGAACMDALLALKRKLEKK